MIKAVPDTNIWLASIQWTGKPYRIRLHAESGKITLVSSLGIMAELTRVLREYFGFSDDDAYYWHQHLIALCEIVHPAKFVNAVQSNPDDNKFIECAMESKCSYIISRDNDLLRLKEYEGIKIVNDVEFLSILEKNDSENRVYQTS